METPSTKEPGKKPQTHSVSQTPEDINSSNRGRPSRGRRFLKRAVVYACLLATLGYLSGRFITETSLFKILVEEYLTLRSGMLVTFGEVSPSGGAGWGVRIGRLAVMDGAKPLLSASTAVVEIDLPSALHGDLHFNSVYLSGARLNLVRNRAGRLNIGAWESQSIPFEAMPRKIKRFLRAFDSILIDRCGLSWTDEMVGKKSPYNIEFHGIKLRLGPARLFGGERAVALETVAQTPKGLGELRIRGRITNIGGSAPGLGFDGNVMAQGLDVGHFWPYLGKILPFQRLDLAASLDSHVSMGPGKGFSSKGTVTVSGLDLLYREAYRQGLKAGRISLAHDVSVMGDSIAVRSAELDAGPLKIRLSGEGHKLKSANPLFYVEMDLEKTPIAELKKYVPYNYLTPVQAGFIEKNIAAGEIRITGLTYDGDLETLERLDKIESYKSISGMLEIFGLRLAIPGLEREFRDIGGEFILAGDQLFFNDLTGEYGKSALRNVTGVASQLHEWPTFEVKINAGLDLEEARRGVAAHILSPEFRSALDQVESMTGSVGLDLTVKGDSENLAQTLVSEGKMVFSGVGVKSPLFPMPVSQMNGVVALGRGKATIAGLKWRVGQSRFAMTGEISDVLKSSPSFDLKILSGLDLGEAARLLPARPKDLEMLGGPGAAVTTLKGGFGAYTHQTTIDLTDADVIYANTVFKRPGMPASVTAWGMGKFGGGAQINGAVLEFGASRAEAVGDVLGFLKDQKTQVKVSAERIYFDDLDRYTDLFDNIESKGYITGDFTAANGGPGAPIELFGAARVVDGRFKLNAFTAAFDECGGDFELAGRRVFLKKGAGTFGKGRFTMSGSADAGRSAFKLNAVTTALDLDDLFGDPVLELMDRPFKSGVEYLWKDPAAGEKKPRAFFDGEWDIIISSQSGGIGPLLYRSLDARIAYKDDHFQVRPFTFEGHGGKWSWDADIGQLRRSIDFKSVVNIRDAAMESFGSPAPEKLIYGLININGEVNGRGRTWKQIRSTLDGRLELAAGAGVIKRFNLLGKIFSLLNLSQYFKLKLPDLSVEGLPFNSVTAVFDLAGGKAYTKGLVVDSEAIRLTAVGDYDVGSGRVDMVVGAMPFVTIDRALSSIPLFGEVLTGDSKSFIGYYFSAKGPLENPEITSVSLEALAEGIRGIFRRIMELPAKAGKTLNGTKGSGK